ncbi:MAG: glycosyltransferase family 4 protein, partial [Planctomycetota bacterium]
MRIGINFHTSDEYISGVEHYSLGLLNGLLRIDTKNQYVVYTNTPDLLRARVAHSKNLTIVGIKYLKARIARILWEHTQLPSLAERQEVDILHCLSYICPLRKKAVPYVVTIHDTIAIDHPEWCKQTNALYFKLFMKAATKRASCVISPSKCTADSLRSKSYVHGSRIKVVYPGIDRIFDTSRSSSRCLEVRRRYSLPDRYALYVGNIEPKKNIWTLLCVHRRLQERIASYKLVIVGKRSWGTRAEIHRIAKEVSSNNVVMTGYVARNDLPFVYKNADVFVFPSFYEGFGFPPVEAMACGTPVVSSSRGALKETLGDAALIVEPHNIRQIAESVFVMINDPWLRKKHIRAGLA